MKKAVKFVLKILLYYSPVFLKQYLTNIKTKKELNIALARSRRTKVKREELDRVVQALELNCDVFLHTSMINIGKIEGGAKFVVETILKKVDIKHHTLLVSALPYRGSFYEYLRKNPEFDVRNACVAMGAINERFAMLENACRSIHPTHSVVAIGSQAKEYTATHYMDETPFGEHSPYLKIFKNKGKILLLGATLNNVTAIHALEDLLEDVYPIKIYDKEVYKVKCYDQEGKELIVSTKCHHPIRCILRDVSVMKKNLEEKNAIKVYPIGESNIMLIDTTLFAACYFEMLTRGNSIYGRKHKVTPKLHEAIEKAKRTIGIE